MHRRHIVVLTGAGISAESGIPTFRGSGGLWFKYRIEDVATPEAFARDPAMVLDFYNQRRAQLESVQPNEAHKALARLEQGHKVSVVTQNVDDLHERAGSTRVLHLHGEIMKARSTADPGLVVRLNGPSLRLGDRCSLGSQLRPHIVWFGEEVPLMPLAASIVHQADLLIVVGTSLQVYPAAGLVHAAPAHCPVYLVDPAPVRIEGRPVRHLMRSASEGIPLLAEHLVTGRPLP